MRRCSPFNDFFSDTNLIFESLKSMRSPIGHCRTTNKRWRNPSNPTNLYLLRKVVLRWKWRRYKNVSFMARKRLKKIVKQREFVCERMKKFTEKWNRRQQLTLREIFIQWIVGKLKHDMILFFSSFFVIWMFSLSSLPHAFSNAETRILSDKQFKQLWVVSIECFNNCWNPYHIHCRMLQCSMVNSTFVSNTVSCIKNSNSNSHSEKKWKEFKMKRKEREK